MYILYFLNPLHYTLVFFHQIKLNAQEILPLSKKFYIFVQQQKATNCICRMRGHFHPHLHYSYLPHLHHFQQ